jgi:hypothetical protein
MPEGAGIEDLVDGRLGQVIEVEAVRVVPQECHHVIVRCTSNSAYIGSGGFLIGVRMWEWYWPLLPYLGRWRLGRGRPVLATSPCMGDAGPAMGG